MTRDTKNKLPESLKSEAQDQKELEAWSTLWKESSEDDEIDMNEKERLQQIEERLMQHTADPAPLRLVDENSGLSKLKWVAMAAVFLVAAIGSTIWLSDIEHQAENGQTLAVELVDGSTVVLNSGSKLSYSRMNKQRVRLEGEAFFDINHQDESFVVETFNSEIEVLGTRFNIRAWNKTMDRQTVVSLESGSIRLRHSKQAQQFVMMKPGDTRRVVADQDQISDLESNSLDDAMAWFEGDFVHQDQFIGVILDDLQRRFDISLKYDRQIRQQKVSIVIRQPESIERILDDLCGSLNFEYRPILDGFEIIGSSTGAVSNGSSLVAP